MTIYYGISFITVIGHNLTKYELFIIITVIPVCARINRWERQRTSPERPVSVNYNGTDWTPMRSRVLHQVYEESTLSMQYNRSTGERFPGDWENRPSTKVLYTLPPLARSCWLPSSSLSSPPPPSSSE